MSSTITELEDSDEDFEDEESNDELNEEINEDFEDSFEDELENKAEDKLEEDVGLKDEKLAELKKDNDEEDEDFAVEVIKVLGSAQFLELSEDELALELTEEEVEELTREPVRELLDKLEIVELERLDRLETLLLEEQINEPVIPAA